MPTIPTTIYTTYSTAKQATQCTTITSALDPTNQLANVPTKQTTYEQALGQPNNIPVISTILSAHFNSIIGTYCIPFSSTDWQSNQCPYK